MYRCPTCGQAKCICKGTAPWSGTALDIPAEGTVMATGKLVRVQTGPTSYLKMTEDEAKAYRANVGEYNAPAVQPEPTGDGLDELTVPVLTEQANALGIDTKDMKKADLVTAIRAKQGESS